MLRAVAGEVNRVVYDARVRRVRAEAITTERYAAYGAIVRAGDAASARSANHGTASAWDALATLVNARGDAARATASLFRCAPHAGDVLAVRWLERHPTSTQLFVPMGAARYLVVVARGDDAPDLDTLAAFVVEGAQAITYAPGVWHHPMVVLDADVDFVNVLFVDGSERDCDERRFDVPEIEVAIG
jgi:ureidoglycolate lyase